MPRPATIAALRRQIDRLDDRVLALLNRRARLAQAIGSAKARALTGVYAPGREKQGLARMGETNRRPPAHAPVRAILRQVVSSARSPEEPLPVPPPRPQATY